MKNLIALVVLFAVTPVAFAAENQKIENNFGKSECSKYVKLLEAKKQSKDLQQQVQSQASK